MGPGAPVSPSGLVSFCLICADSIIRGTLPQWVARDAASKAPVQTQQKRVSVLSQLVGKRRHEPARLLCPPRNYSSAL